MIEIVILAALTIYGIQKVVDSLIFTITGRWLDDWFEVLNRPKWAKPLIFCSLCMSSVWGVPVLFAWNCPSWHLIPAIFAVACVIYLIDRWG